MDQSSWLEDVQKYLENVQLADNVKEELRGYVADIQQTNVLSRTQDASDNKSLNYILTLNNVANLVNAIHQMAGNRLPWSYNIIVNGIIAVLGTPTEKDADNEVIQRFEKVMSAAFISKCRVACQKIVYCVRYVQSMPRASQDDQEKRHLIQQLSTEFPLHGVFTEVLELGDKIKRLVAEGDVRNFGDLMMNVELYCTLTTYVELFLLLRIAVQKVYGADSAPVQAILLEHRDTDKVVLSFLHRPTVKTIRFVYKIHNIFVWPVLLCFIQRRKLFLDSLSHLSKKYFQIRPMKDPTKAVVAQNVLFNLYKTLYYFKGKGDKYRLDKIDSVNNLPTFTIKSTTGEYVTSDNGITKVKTGEPSEASRVWNIVKVHPESEVESPGYVIWLAHNRFNCLTTKWLWLVDAECSDYPGDTYVWVLNAVWYM